MKRLLPAFWAVLISLSIFSGCEKAPSERFQTSYTDVFDTVCSFVAYCDSEEEFKSVSESLHGELLRLHRLFDIYEGPAEGGLLALNRDGYLENPDEDIVSLLELGIEYYELSGGKLNIAMGSVLSIWHDSREAGALPDKDRLAQASEHMDISKLAIGEDRITLSDPEMRIDVGSIAKGYAAQKAAGLIRDLGLKNFALDLGGNIKTSGKKPDGEWYIGIQDPNGGVLTGVEATELSSDEPNGMSVVTSGDYERFFELDGVRYSHIISPDTLYPADMYRSVTVICENSADGDALSTSLFCMDFESGKALCEKLEIRAVWVLPDGSTMTVGDIEI